MPSLCPSGLHLLQNQLWYSTLPFLGLSKNFSNPTLEQVRRLHLRGWSLRAISRLLSFVDDVRTILTTGELFWQLNVLPTMIYGTNSLKTVNALFP